MRWLGVATGRVLLLLMLECGISFYKLVLFYSGSRLKRARPACSGFCYEQALPTDSFRRCQSMSLRSWTKELNSLASKNFEESLPMLTWERFDLKKRKRYRNSKQSFGVKSWINFVFRFALLALSLSLRFIFRLDPDISDHSTETSTSLD